MSNSNQNDEPTNSKPTSTTIRIRRICGTLIAALGVLAIVYALIAFFLFPDLPPNTTFSKLPSLYVAGVGTALALLGFTVRDLRIQNQNPNDAESKREISSTLGILILLALVVLFSLYVASM